MNNNRWVVFGVTAGLFLISMLYRASAAVIAPELARDLGLSSGDLGFLGAVFFYAFALAQLPLGMFLDRIGSRRSMVFLNLVAVAGAAVFANAQGLAGGLVGRALLGLGMSANLMGSLKLFTKWYKPGEFATISGLLVSLGAMGGLLATTPLVLLVNAVGWRGAFLILGLINFVLTISMVAWVRDAPPGQASIQAGQTVSQQPSLLHTAKVLFRDRSYWAIALTAGLRYGVYASIQTLWAGPFLIIHLHLSELTAGNILLLLNIGFILGAPVGGLVSDRVLKSRKKTMFISLFFLTASVLALAHWPGPVFLPILAIIFFIMGFCGAFAQILYAHIKDLMPGEITGTAMTGVNFFVMVGAGVFLHGLGSVVERGQASGLEGGGDYYGAFMLCFLTLLVATVIYGFSRDAKPDANKP